MIVPLGTSCSKCGAGAAHVSSTDRFGFHVTLPLFHESNGSFLLQKCGGPIGGAIWERRREALGLVGGGPAHPLPGVLSGVADEEALAEECLRRGQHALQGPPPGSARSSKPPKSTPVTRLTPHSIWEEDEEQDRLRVPGNWDAPMTSAGVQRGAGVEHPQSNPPPDSGEQGQKSRLCCCVLT